MCVHLTEHEELIVDTFAEEFYEEIRAGATVSMESYLQRLPGEKLKEAFTITVNMMLLMDCFGNHENKKDPLWQQKTATEENQPHEVCIN